MILAGIVVVGIFASRPGHDAAKTDSPAPAKIGAPSRLRIPKIAVNATVEPVGVTNDGTMDVPKGVLNAAWYQPGPPPGEAGSAVIDGHFDQVGGKPAVFYNLQDLRPGDKVTIEDSNGISISFVVREARKYDPKAETTAIFKSTDGKAHLNLITCSGNWDTAAQSYSSRLVVFTDKEEK